MSRGDMFARRGASSRGRVHSGVASAAVPIGAKDPLTIVSSVAPFFFLSGDLGITLGTGVSAWADQTVNGRNGSQATGASQPAYSVTDADFGGRGALLGDGVDDSMTIAWDPPAPLTTNIWFFAVIRTVGYTAGTYLMGGGNLILGVAQSVASPQLRQFNTTGANTNSGAAVGSSVRLSALFSGSANDYLRCGASKISGSNAGNSDAAGFALFARFGPLGFGNSKIACVGAWAGEPTPGEQAALDTWVTAWYGGGVGV